MAKAWYPVIDYLECMECGSCIKKCSHGVYDKSIAPTPVVSNPAACIDHCHGCGNLCPQGAITYVGDDTGWKPPHGNRQEANETCCCSYKEKKQIVIEFLYLDLNTCERCMTTDTTLDEAVNELSGILDSLGYHITVNKVNIISAEMAEQYQFLSSPTIRINGFDICMDVKENECKDCGDLCGSDVDCRVFVYDGIEYNQPPKAMIMDGILKTIYIPPQVSEDTPYRLPENLILFFEGKATACCDGDCSCPDGCQ